MIVVRDIRSEGRDGTKRKVYRRSEETEPVQRTYRNRSDFGEIGAEKSVLERRAKFGDKGTFIEEWGIKKGVSAIIVSGSDFVEITNVLFYDEMITCFCKLQS